MSTSDREVARQLVLQATETRYVVPEGGIDVLAKESQLIDAITRALTAARQEQAERNAAQERLNNAVMYALREGCFSPVPEPRKGATTEELIKWGAMRSLHDAIAEFNRAAAKEGK